MVSEASTTRFKDLSIQGFRRLYDVRLALRPLCVMIGANGTGKTSVLDVLSLLASSAQGRLSESITDLSGLARVLTYDRAEELRLGISMTVPQHEPLEYSLGLRPQGVTYVINEEKLSQRRQQGRRPFSHIDSRGPDIKYFEAEQKRLVRPNWEHKPLETSLAQVPKMFREPEEFRNRLSSSTFYHVLNVDSRSPVRLPQALLPAALPGKNGEELVSCLFYLREAERLVSRRSRTLFALRFHDSIVLTSPPLRRARLLWRGGRPDSHSLSICISCQRGRFASCGLRHYYRVLV